MTQKDRIDELMKKTNIESDKSLLIKIIEMIGKERVTIDTYEKKKSNFSKMLSGERDFTLDYIVALEKIFNVPFVYIKEGKTEFEMGFIPKGMRYTCYKNSYEAFEELDKDLTDNCCSVLTSSDEYGKHLLDYIIEYNSIEGIRYLVKDHSLKYRSLNDTMFLDNGMIFARNDDYVFLIAKMLIENNEIELFNSIFDHYSLIYYYSDYKSIYVNEEFYKLILNNEDALNSILNCRDLEWSYGNHGNKYIKENNQILLNVNPLINIIYNYAIKHYNIYEKQVNKILQEALMLNEETLKCFVGKFPDLKDIDIPKNGIIEIGRERYCSIFNPNIFDAEVSNLTSSLIKENKNLIQNMLNKNAEKINEINEVRLLDYIYTYSFIKDGFRNDESCLNTIKTMLNKNKVGEDYKKEFATHFKNYLEEKVLRLDKNDSNYKQHYKELRWSLLFIEIYEEELNSF